MMFVCRIGLMLDGKCRRSGLCSIYYVKEVMNECSIWCPPLPGALGQPGIPLTKVGAMGAVGRSTTSRQVNDTSND